MEQLLDLNPFIVGAIAWLLFYVAMEMGRKMGQRRIRTSGESSITSNGVIDAAIFAIIGLLLAFSFSGAAQRFDHRRDLIVEEGNAVGTAYLRIDLVPADAQPALRDAFSRYVDSRVEAYKSLDDESEFRARLAKSALIQDEIWQLAIEAGKRDDAPPAANMLLLPALNQMIDITSTRKMSLVMHPPIVIYLLLLALAFIGCVLAGYVMSESSKRSLVHQICFATVLTVALYVVLDMEYPRRGLIRIDSFGAAVLEDSMFRKAN